MGRSVIMVVYLSSDESKFKRKYGRGRPLRNGWVFGIIERGEPGRALMINVPDRSRETLEPITRQWVSRYSSTGGTRDDLGENLGVDILLYIIVDVL